MDIERPAASAVNGPSPEASGTAPSKSPIIPSDDNAGASRGGKIPRSFRDVEGMSQTDLDSMIGDQQHAKKKGGKGKGELGQDTDPEESEDIDAEDEDEFDEGEDTETDAPEDAEPEDDDTGAEEDEESEEDDSEEEDPDAEAADGEETDGEDDGTLHAVKVDGKVRKYTLSQLKNMVSSGEHTLAKRREFDAFVAKTNNEINTRAQKFQEIDRMVTPAFEHIKAGKIDEAIYAIAETAKMSRLDIKRTLLKRFIPVVAARLGIPQNVLDQRLLAMESHNKVIDTEEENQFLKSEGEKARAQRDKKPDPTSVKSEKLRGLQLEHGISAKEIDQVGDWLIHQYGDVSKIPPHQPEQLVDIALKRRYCEKAIEVIAQRRSRLLKDQKFVDRTVRKLVNNPTWTTQRLGRWVTKQARLLSESAKPNESSLHKEISRKALKTSDKARYQSPKRTQTKAMRFSDIGSDDLI